MKDSKTLVLAVFVAVTLTAPNLVGTVSAHPPGGHEVKTKGNSKHYFCYDKHGRWRSHQHRPAPQPSYSPRHYGHREPHYRYHHHHDARYSYQRRPQVIYVRKDVPYDYRSRYIKPAVRDSRTIVINDARRDVQLGRDQLRDDRAELKKDRAELRRDIRNHASKEEIRSDRQEIRADLQRIKSSRQEIRNDRRDLARR